MEENRDKTGEKKTEEAETQEEKTARERLENAVSSFRQWLDSFLKELSSIVPAILTPEIMTAIASRFLSGVVGSSLSSGLMGSSKIVLKAVTIPRLLSKARKIARKSGIVIVLLCALATIIRFVPVFYGYCSDISWRDDLSSGDTSTRRAASLHFLEITSGEDRKALDVLRELAIGGDALSCLHLANFYCLREFEPVTYTQRLDEGRAAYWYLQGANKGDALCQARIGECYLIGSGVGKDVSKAYHFISMSASKNDPLGLKLMGDCLYMGYGISPDLKKAQRCWEMSRSGGNEDAARSLERIFEQDSLAHD